MRPAVIPINDLRLGAGERSGIESAISRVVASGRFIGGPEVDAFEQEFAEACGTPHCISVASGTDALILSLRALELEPGSKVATVAVAGGYSSAAIEQNGLSPAYIDIEADGRMDVQALRTHLRTGEIRAVIVTHLYGNTAGAADIAAACRDHDIPLIEDCAQAHGAMTPSGPVGSLGTMGCFSFYPTKNLGALGDGGAITTLDGSTAARLRVLKNYGWTNDRYVSNTVGGINSRLDELQAAILRVRIPHLRNLNKRRQAIAARYIACLDDLALGLERTVGPHDVFHLFVVKSPRRDEARRYFHGAGISTDVHYPVPDHAQPRYASGKNSCGPMKNSDSHCASIFTIPCYPAMTDESVDRICHALQSEEWR